MAKSNPRWRILLWRAVGCGLVLIPALTWTSPKYALPIGLSLPRAVAPEPSAIMPAEPAVNVVSQPGGSVLDQIELSSAGQPAPAPAVVVDAQLDPWLCAAFAWAAVTCVLLLVYAKKYVALRHILAASVPAPIPMQRALRDLAAQFACGRPRLLLSARVPAPILVGIRRPAIILPERLVDDLTPTDLAGILAHELSHVSSHDLAWTRFLQILSTLLWFHPLVWKLRAAHDFSCELVCDHVASHFSGGADQYSRTLADVALAMAGQWKPNFGLAMARRPDILTRLDFLNQKLKALPLERGRKVLALALAAVLLGCITSADLKPALETRSAALPEGGTTNEPPMAAMAGPAGVPMVMARTAVPPEGGTTNEGAPVAAMAVPAGVPMVMARTTVPPEGGTTNEAAPMAAMAAPAGVPMMAMQLADDTSSASANAAPPMVMMARSAAPHNLRVAAPPRGWTAGEAAPDSRLIGLEIVPLTVNDTRAREFIARYSLTTNTLGRLEESSLGDNNLGTLIQIARSRVHGNQQIQKNGLDSALRLLEAEGIVNLMKPITVNARDGVPANIGYLADCVPQAEALRQFGEFTHTQIAWSDFNVAQFGEPSATNARVSMLMRIVPHLTMKDDKDAAQLEIKLLTLHAPETAAKPQPGVVLPPPPSIMRRSVVTSDPVLQDGSSIVLGAWNSERSSTYTGGVPVMRNIPIAGKLFTRTVQMRTHETTMIMIRCKIDE